MQTPNHPKSPDRISSHERTGKILVVEDEPVITEELVELLQHCGYVADSAPSVSAALAYLAERHDVDVVLCDLVLPDGNGLELLEHLRPPERLRPAVVFVTGKASVETAAQAMRAGAFDYLEKPVRLELLLDSVGRALDIINHKEQERSQKTQITRSLTELYNLFAKLEPASIDAEALNIPARAGNQFSADGKRNNSIVLDGITKINKIYDLRRRLMPEVAFSDPYWDILLIIFDSAMRERLVSITSVCYAITGSTSSALRRIYDLEALGVLVRKADDNDRRRVYISLSPKAFAALHEFFLSL